MFYNLVLHGRPPTKQVSFRARMASTLFLRSRNIHQLFGCLQSKNFINLDFPCVCLYMLENNGIDYNALVFTAGK